jgi:hypothetical protein
MRKAFILFETNHSPSSGPGVVRVICDPVDTRRDRYTFEYRAVDGMGEVSWRPLSKRQLDDMVTALHSICSELEWNLPKPELGEE